MTSARLAFPLNLDDTFGFSLCIDAVHHPATTDSNMIALGRLETGRSTRALSMKVFAHGMFVEPAAHRPICTALPPAEINDAPTSFSLVLGLAVGRHHT